MIASMARTRRILGPDGDEHEAEPIGFRASGEHFNEYLLDDGVILRVKLVLTDLWKAKEAYDPYGDPPLLGGAITGRRGRCARRAQGRRRGLVKKATDSTMVTTKKFTWTGMPTKRPKKRAP
jgi:hypothetical protein